MSQVCILNFLKVRKVTTITNIYIGFHLILLILNFVMSEKIGNSQFYNIDLYYFIDNNFYFKDILNH